MTPRRSADPHVLEPGHAPTPFTADDIRAGCPAGRTITLIVERPGLEPLTRLNRFIDCDEQGAVIERMGVADDGQRGTATMDRATWLQLQAHASFPADATTVDSVRLLTPMGELDCLRYTVSEGSSVHTLWFALAAPGMPVMATVHDDGELRETTTMVSDVRP
jgi:hypothetical protein